MATFYGGWVSTDDFRAILEATVSNTSATQCAVKLVLKVQSNYAYAGSSGRASVTCNGTTRSDSVSYDAGETTTLMTETFTVARGSAKKSISVSGKVWQTTGGSAYSKGSTASGSVSIPAIDYDAPSAPSSCSASRVSDTQAKATWKNGSTSTTKPRSSTKVERQTDGGSWVQVASVGASTTSYTDNSVSANHRYRYRVRAQGSGGYSGYATSGYIYTTPAAPQSVGVAVATGTTCTVDVDGSNAPYAESWEVQSQLNGGEWQAVGTYATFPQTVDLGGGTVKIRARSVRGSLSSAWAESATITTITPPLAPTVALDPSGVQPTGTAVTASWVPSHPDGSAQTQAQVAYKVGSAAEQTATVSGTATTYQLPVEATAAPATVSVRVRTHGADEDWGAWSEPVTMTVAEPPSVAITSPAADGAVVADLPLEAAWTVSDVTGVAAQTLTIYDASGRALHTARLDGSARSYELGPATYMLSNSAGYTLRLDVTGGSSLTASEERDFHTSFAEPSAPGVDAEIDESDMSVELTVHAGPSSTDAGEVVTVAEHAPAGTPVPGFTVYGNTSQNLWVNPTRGGSGVSITGNPDGSMTLAGTNETDETAWIGYVKRYTLRIGSTYTLSTDHALPAGIAIRVETRDVSDVVIDTMTMKLEAGTNVDTGVIQDDAAYVNLVITVGPGITASGTYRVMLNEGSEPRPWCPPGLNGVDELAIVTAGKNLLDTSSYDRKTSSGITTKVNDDGSVTLSGTLSGNQAVGLAHIGFGYALPPGDYIFSGIEVDDNVYVQLNRNASTVFGGTNGERKFTVTENDAIYDNPFWFIGVKPGFSGTKTIRPQLEVGSEATDWVSPEPLTTTPIDLDGHTLNSLPDGTRDELTVDASGNVTLEKRVGVATLPSSASSWVSDNGRFQTSVCSPPAKSNYTNGSVLSDALPSRVNNVDNPYNGTCIIASDSYAFATVGTGETTQTITSVCGGKTLLYALATPETIELPSVTLPSWPEGEASLWASAPVPAEMRVDYPDVDHLTVQRVNADGSLWVVGDGLADGETVVDPLPPLNSPVDYIVTAHTAAGATSEVRVTETLQALVGAFNFGSAAGTCELAELNPDWSHDVARPGTLYHFADGGEGGGLPVAYGGQDVDATRSMGFTLLDLDQLRRLQDIARRYFTCWYRDPYGGRALCSVSWSFSSGIPYDKLSVSASMTETVFEEAW